MSKDSEMSETVRKLSAFPRGVQFTPIPNPLLSGLLEEINDVFELKTILRAIWAIHRKPGPIPFIRIGDLSSDRTMSKVLNDVGDRLEIKIRQFLQSAVARGILLEVIENEKDLKSDDSDNAKYVLNIEPIRQAINKNGLTTNENILHEPIQGEDQPNLSTGAFRAYEENIGPLTPLIADRIRDALLEHSDTEIIDALRIATESNVRNWKYAAAILKRWSSEGRNERENYGKSERNIKTTSSDEFIERYLERQRARGNI